MSEEISTGVMPSILDRISEREVCNWMLARLEAIRAGKLPGCHTLSVAASHYSHLQEPFISWGMHAAGECVISEPNTDTAVSNLLKVIHHDPKAAAREKRRLAKDMIEEAEQLEKIAATI